MICSEEDRKYNVYICDIGAKTGQNTLCEDGDEGSPLLCQSHLKGGGAGGSAPPTAKYRMMDKLRLLKYNRWRLDRADDTGGSEDGLFIYGIADVVRSKMRCSSISSNQKKDRNMFLYMLRYAAWINTVLEEFDEQEQLGNENSTAITADIISSQSSTDVARTTSTQLPEYYDMDDYINTRKKPIRCKGNAVADRRLTANFHRSSYIAQRKESFVFGPGGRTLMTGSGGSSPSRCPVVRPISYSVLFSFLLVVAVHRLH